MGRALEELTDLGADKKELGDRQRIWDPKEYSALREVMQVWGCLPSCATCLLFLECMNSCTPAITFMMTFTANMFLEGCRCLGCTH